MPRRNFSDGQEITHGDLSKVSSTLEMELYDRIMYELMNRQRDVMFGDSFEVSYVNSTTLEIAAGNGVQYDSAQVSPEPKSRLLYLAAAEEVTVNAPDAANNRIDIVSIKATRVTTVTESRNVKNALDGLVSAQNLAVQTDWDLDIVVTAGTPAASPAVPATPAGYIKIAEVLVTAVTGISGASAVTDKRTRFKPGSNFRSMTTVTAAYIADKDDNTILANASGGNFSITLPPVDEVSGQEFTIKNIGASGTVTVNCDGADTIDGASEQLLEAQYSSITMRSNGTGYYLV